MRDWRDRVVDLIDKKPRTAALALFALSLGLAVGGVTSFATRSMVNEQHEITMQKIKEVEKDGDRLYREVRDMSHKMDILILRVK